MKNNLERESKSVRERQSEKGEGGTKAGAPPADSLNSLKHRNAHTHAHTPYPPLSTGHYKAPKLSTLYNIVHPFWEEGGAYSPAFHTKLQQHLLCVVNISCIHFGCYA